MSENKKNNFFSNLIFTLPLLIKGGFRKEKLFGFIPNPAFRNRFSSLFTLLYIFGLIFFLPSLLRSFVGTINEVGFSISIFFKIISWIILYIIIFLLLFDIKRIKYIWDYSNSEWYLTSKLTPKQTARDKGQLGEYFAIYEIKRKYEKWDMPYKLYCNLVVPKKYSDSGSAKFKKLVDFSEIDCLVLSPCGCDVFEIKNRGGVFEGATGNDKWCQRIGRQMHELENPLKQNNKHILVLNNYIENARPDKKPQIASRPIYRNIVFYSNSDATFNFGIPEYIDFSPEYAWSVMNLDSFRSGFKLDEASYLNIRFFKELLPIFEEVLDNLEVYDREEMRYLLSTRQMYYDSLKSNQN